MDRSLTDGHGHRPLLRTGLVGLALLTLLLGGPTGRAPRASAQPTPDPQSGTVVAGPTRFEVVSPTLVRLEYAADGRFFDGQSVTTVPRGGPPPAYEVRHEQGWLVVTTAALTLRYREGSGPFTPANLSVDLDVAGTPTTAHPSWPAAPGRCAYAMRCEAEDGRLTGGLGVGYEHAGHSGRGYVSDRGQLGARASWTLTGAPGAGGQVLQAAYANGSRRTRTLAIEVDGRPAGRLRLPPTGGWDTWKIVAMPLDDVRGGTVVSALCTTGLRCGVNVDAVAVTRRGQPFPATTGTVPPPADVPGQLGGWTRGLDVYPDQAGPDVASYALHSGVLNRQGWWLLDDTYSATRTTEGWVTPRPGGTRAYQDGYFFGYGHDYARALDDLRVLTGPAVLLPQWAFGVWYSIFDAIPAKTYEDALLPAFAAHQVPLDALSVDTDWKSPVRWDGWSWNRRLFPDPAAFAAWARGQGVNVVLNVHTGISADDPAFARTQGATGGRLVPAAACFSPRCYRFDFGDRRQAQAWFALHRPVEQQGFRHWWLDWCCTDSVVDVPGVTPDSWLNEQYARRLAADGTRGFVLSRIGASYADFRGAYPSGAWGEHRTTVHFTGDTAPTWETLAYAARLSQAEASIGLPYVSDDIGSFLGRHLPDDLYVRWVQLGTFQPVLRLHSHHGDRLPWQYAAGAEPAADFLRLRESLVPYTYSLGWDATRTGLPMTRPLYLDHPESPEAYAYPDEYLYGRDVLVAPVTAPGATASRTVWFPPGRWVGWFDGRTHTGPSTATVTVPLDQMPVFLRGGAIVPRLPGVSRVDPDPATLTLTVASGPDPNSFTLHTDAGEGNSASADTLLSYASRPGHWWRRASSSVTVGAASGSFGGRTERAYVVDLVDVGRPHSVEVDGSSLSEAAPEATGPGWWYDDAAATLHVRTASLPLTAAHLITQHGGKVLDRP